VVVVAATNRPDMVDPALLRPGRLDRLIYIRPPDIREREMIFTLHLRGKPLYPGVEVKKLAEMTESYAGADIEAICREAAMFALRDSIKHGMEKEEVIRAARDVSIKMEHFGKAFSMVRPTPNDLTVFESMTEFRKAVHKHKKKKVK
jgi:transitional endoplasmic reticulum ATPase